MSSNPKKAYGDAKIPMHLVPPALQISAARGLGEGAEKYGPYNWRETNVEATTYIGAIERHLAAYKDGEDVDPDSAVGKRHLDGIAASLAILIDATDGGFLIDNRPPPGPASRLVLQTRWRVRWMDARGLDLSSVFDDFGSADEFGMARKCEGFSVTVEKIATTTG